MKYLAFISYVHGDRDSKVAASLLRYLCNFSLPGHFRRKYPDLPTTGYDVVLDDSHFKPTELWPQIKEKLEESEYVIVLCSKSYLERKASLEKKAGSDTEEKTWVDREVEYFLECHGPDAESRVLPLVLDPRQWHEIIPDSIKEGRIRENALYYEEQESHGSYCALLEKMFGLKETGMLWRIQRRKESLRALGKGTVWTLFAGGCLLPALAALYLFSAQVNLTAGMQLLQRGIFPHQYIDVMHTAAMEENVHELQLLMNSGSPVLGRKEVQTCLNEYLSASKSGGNADVVRLLSERLRLLTAGEAGGLYAQPEQCRKLIQEAVASGDSEILLNLLFSVSAEQAEKSEEFVWSLLRKSGTPHRDMVKAYAASQLAATEIWEAKYGDFLRTAADKGDLRTLRLLLMAGVNPDDTDASGFFALCRAAQRGHLDCLKELHESGADMHLINRETGRPAIIYAVGNERLECIRYMIAHGAKENLEMKDGTIVERGEALLSTFAIMQDKAKALESLMDSGVDANAVVLVYDKDDLIASEPTLLAALKRGNAACLKILIDAGADIRAHYLGASFLEMAVMMKSAECVRILLDAGLDVRMRIPDGRTLLHLAGCADTIKVLCEKGADKEALAQGETPLLWWLTQEKPELVNALLENGASANARDEWGKTALMRAVMKNQVEMLEPLLKHGADVNAMDRDGKTAIEYAQRSGNQKIVDILTKYKETNEL